MQFHEEEDFSKDFHIGIWKNLLRYAKPFYKHLGLIALLMLACAALDAVLPQLTREAIDLYVANGTTESIGRFIIKYAAVLAAQVICISSFIRLAGYVEVSMCHRIRSIGFKKLQELSLSFYDKTPVGYIIARLTNDTQRLGDTIGWGLIDLLWGLFYVCITVGIMISMNAPLAFGVMLVIPVIGAAAFYFQQKILRAYREVRKINSKITGAFNEGIMGAKTTKTLVREQKNAQEFGVLTSSMKGAAIRAARLNALFLPIVMSLGSIAASYALWRGGYDVFSGTVSFGVLTVFITYSIQLFDPITHIARTFAELQSSQAAAERVVKLIETQPEITDSGAIEDIYGDSFTPHNENWPRIIGDVAFENVSFNYSGGEEVLNHFTLHIKAGQTIALVGETRSGKSTIVNLICRFYEPSDGRILIDGVDYRERSQLWLQSNLGYVLQ
ncbi:MAG: ABC transporter transmembrane domain-containing protein, partial [Clostridia bacterium]|nr:ABC transporter transmembrane domain-containing protein [Clostridia bacterium]